MSVYRVFTISSGAVSEGAKIDILPLKGAGITIPAVIIGEEGRGRERGVVPVGNPPTVPCPRRGQEISGSTLARFKAPERPATCECGVALPLWGKRPDDSGYWFVQHPDTGSVPSRLMAAEIGATKAGKPKFWAKPAADTTEKVLVVFRTRMGYRGGNDHTGDRNGLFRVGDSWDPWAASGLTLEEAQALCAEHEVDSSRIRPDGFLPFPGEVITRGYIAQGGAGRMGGGEQLVALVPKDVVFRTSYSGRLYGGPGAHYYVWDGEKVLAATWEERSAADLF
ncbi:MAG: hypothetical protein WCV86_02665 [Patescibacteria group bacterium]|jgi:hypothetical protein